MATYLTQAISSVLRQSNQDFEIVVSDNNSSDNTEELVSKFGDSRIKYYRQSSNIGVFGNLNFSCSKAQGRFIKTLCADDMLAPNCLEILDNSMQSVSSKFKTWALKHTDTVDELSGSATYTSSPIEKGDFTSILNNHWYGGISHLCVESDYFRRMGFFGDFNKLTDYSRDIVACFDLMRHAPSIIIFEPLIFERVHPEQTRYKISKIRQLNEFFSYRRSLGEVESTRHAAAWDAYLDELVANHLLSSLKQAVRHRSLEPLREVKSIIRQHEYNRFPLRLVLRRLSNVLRESVSG